MVSGLVPAYLHETAGRLPHLSEAGRRALEWGAWALAGLWCVRTSTAMRRLPEVADLTEVRWDLCPTQAPGLVVVVPARDEEAVLEGAMATLMAQDYPWLQVVAVDDNSRDGTGALLEALAAKHEGKLALIHLTETAEGWVGKTFALEMGAGRSRSEWLLFTEADVWFSPSLLRRALAYAQMVGADHLVVAPSAVTRGWGPKALLGFLGLLQMWFVRPWRVTDRGARWDAVGAGAFNLIRRDAWEELGGFEPQRLAICDALTLGKRVRAAGMRQHVAFAPGLVLQARPGGVSGMVARLARTMWPMMNLRLWLAVVFSVFVVMVFCAPLAGLLWWRTLVPAVLVVACMAVQYQLLGEVAGVEARWGWLLPVGAALVLWSLLRSIVATVWRGGVRWRGAVYSLRTLRRWNSPFQWEFEAARERAGRRRAERVGRRRMWRARRRGM